MTQRCTHAWAEKYFWPKVAKVDNCWVWTASKNERGYGRIAGKALGGNRLAHCVSWELANASDVPAGQFVLHACDNPPCVNPGHLFLGTQKDNIADMISKGRARRGKLPGSLNPNARLDEALVEQIRSRRSEGPTAIAKAFGVSRSTIKDILKGRTWKAANG